MIIVGLGNFGEKYNKTRHNIGFEICHQLASDYNLPSFTKKFHSLFTQGKIAEKNIKMILPQTYMNNSGLAVQEICHFYKEHISNVIVIHDDLDLEFAKIKIKIAGGSGGHNGLKSIDNLAGIDYKRIRIGIGKPLLKAQVHDYVLSKFTDDEQKIIDNKIKLVSDLFPLILQNKDGLFLTKYSEKI
ncbi:MAG: aminoacyl-tRNA hydrolase [Rickettsiales bacterium]|nr:aminoacyl-tRNA hydrolase [Rickettsiales bacterium]